VVTYAVAAFLALAIFGTVTRPPKDEVVVLVNVGILLALVLCVAIPETRKARVIRRGRAKARALWEEGLSCEHCGHVTLRGEALNPFDFQSRVWDAGGYRGLQRRSGPAPAMMASRGSA
jgi:hypothetical protein